MIDPYAILGLPKTASEDDIKKAFRSLAKKYHPDLNPGNKASEQKFKEINEAYNMIGTKEAREKFDRGETVSEDYYKDAAGSRSGPFYRDFQDGGGRYTYYYEGDADDVLGSIFEKFGTGGGGDFSIHGQDHVYKMEVDIKDIIHGAEREILMPDGKRLKVKIPPGIEEGSRLRFKGQGGAGRGKGKAGDAYVIISVKPSDIFKVAGKDIETDVSITLDEAVNGSKINVQTVDGTVLLTVPAGVNTGTKLRIKGKGMPGRGGTDRGDQIVTLRVVLPETTDSQFRDFIKNWSKDHPYNPRSN
ncbi:MAG: J domain-containing protein [Spirochaetes bacterium]|nr:J domain-containing protein [Spirochaetota bacterium]